MSGFGSTQALNVEMRVTFDSNVWQQVVSPWDYQHGPDSTTFHWIHSAIVVGQITPFVSESIFTLEAINKDIRSSFMASYEPKFEMKMADELSDDGKIILNFTLCPNPNTHPGNNIYLSFYLKKAVELEFKLMRCVRPANIVNPEISQSLFEESGEGLLPRFAECVEFIENLGCGISHLKNIGNQYVTNPLDWRQGLKHVPPEAVRRLGRAVAEWADGDTISAHYGYKNDYLCTLDEGLSAGVSSIFHVNNRIKLEKQFGLTFVSPQTLCSLI